MTIQYGRHSETNGGEVHSKTVERKTANEMHCQVFQTCSPAHLLTWTPGPCSAAGFLGFVTMIDAFGLSVSDSASATAAAFF